MSGTKAGKETNGFNQAIMIQNSSVLPEDRLHTADGEHHVSRDSKGGQEMTRNSLLVKTAPGP